MKWVVDTLTRWFWAALEWLQGAGADVMNSVLAVAVEYFPDLVPALESQSELIERMNVFFPITETVAFASAYFGLWCVVHAAKIGKWLLAARAVRAVVGGGS